MSMEITNNYAGYTGYTRTEYSEKKEAEEIDKASGSTKAINNSEYLEKLKKQFPELNMEMGSFLSIKNDHKISFKINPRILEKMQNNPEQEKETMELLKGAVAARKLMEMFHKATGHEYVFCHDYIDENGKFHHTSLSVSKNPLNEKLRKKAREETEKRINKSIESARKKRKNFDKQLHDKLNEDKLKATHKSELQVSEKVKELLERKSVKTTDGYLIPRESDFMDIIKIAKEEITPANVGSILDVKV